MEEIHDKEQVCILNHDDKFIQTYIDVQEDEFNYIKSRSISSEVPIVCGYKHTKEFNKEAFIIEKSNKYLKTIAHKAHSIYFYLLDSYRYINQWAVIREDEEGEEYDKYDEVLATTSEEHLQDKVNDISIVLDILVQDLNNKDRDEMIRAQTYYAEQGIIEMLIKLAELNYYKSTRVEERIQDLLGSAQQRIQAVQNMVNEKLEEDEVRPELIADDYLTELNDKILRVIYLLIRFNTENCNIMTKYDRITYSLKELPVENDISSYKPRISTILQETFKRCNFIHNDKGTVMHVEGGLDHEAITSKLIAGVANITDKKLINQIHKWLEMLDIACFDSEDEHNIYQQILFVKVISMFCIKHSRSTYSKNNRNEIQETQDITKLAFNSIKGNRNYQMLVGKFLLATENTILLKFRLEHRVTKIPYVIFPK